MRMLEEISNETEKALQKQWANNALRLLNEAKKEHSLCVENNDMSGTKYWQREIESYTKAYKRYSK